MNVVGDLSMRKHKEDENCSVLPLLKRNPYALWYILSLYYLNLFDAVQMYLFHHVRCTGVSADSMLLNPTKKKMHDFLARKVFACVFMV